MVGGLRRSISLVDPGIPDADLSWRQVLAQLEEERRDPGRAHARALARGEEPLRLIPDLPEDEFPPARAAAALTEVAIPPLDSLVHDEPFFEALQRAPILGGLLNGLRDYYRHAG